MKKVFIFLLPLLTLTLAAHAKTRLGIDELKRSKFAILDGAKVALITNQTGQDSTGQSTAALLKKAPNVKLVSIMSPEHGFTGTQEHGEHVDDSTDTLTGVPVFGLYGKNNRPTDAMLAGADTIVFDIQDIGVRFYTYITTMGQALEKAGEKNLRFIVLDRPNPLRGDITEGDVLDTDIKRMTGYFQIPVRYGLTSGELAGWINKHHEAGARLEVMKMRNWERTLWFDQTGLPFVPPSPNIPTVKTAILYSGIGCFEATNIAVGRGTPTPFELFGAPWIDAKALTAHLRSQNLPGFLFEPAEFTPTKDIYKGQVCHGIKITLTDRQKARPFELFLHAFRYLYENHPINFVPEWEEVRVVTGSGFLKETLEKKGPMGDLIQYYRRKAEEFQQSARPFHLY